VEFKLFGRMRDDGEGADQQQQNSGTDLSEGGLERTIQNMFEQGYSEDEIKQELQGQYSEDEVERAVNRAVKSSASDTDSRPGDPDPMSPYQSQDDQAASPMDEGYNSENDDLNTQDDQQMGGSVNQDMNQNMGGMSQKGGQQENQNSPQPTQQNPDPIQGPGEQPSNDQGQVDPATERLIETIVEEKLENIKAEFDEVYEEIDLIAKETTDLEERIEELEIRDDEDQEQFVQKVEEMEDHIDSYQSRIGGLEKAFQQVLPSLVENVKDLTNLVQEIKEEKNIDTETDLESDEVEDIDMEDW
jgi:hypothetical protein